MNPPKEKKYVEALCKDMTLTHESVTRNKKGTLQGSKRLKQRKNRRTSKRRASKRIFQKKLFDQLNDLARAKEEYDWEVRPKKQKLEETCQTSKPQPELEYKEKTTLSKPKFVPFGSSHQKRRQGDYWPLQNQVSTYSGNERPKFRNERNLSSAKGMKETCHRSSFHPHQQTRSVIPNSSELKSRKISTVPLPKNEPQKPRQPIQRSQHAGTINPVRLNQLHHFKGQQEQQHQRYYKNQPTQNAFGQITLQSQLYDERRKENIRQIQMAERRRREEVRRKMELERRSRISEMERRKYNEPHRKPVTTTQPSHHPYARPNVPMFAHPKPDRNPRAEALSEYSQTLNWQMQMVKEKLRSSYYTEHLEKRNGGHGGGRLVVSKTDHMGHCEYNDNHRDRRRRNDFQRYGRGNGGGRVSPIMTYQQQQHPVIPVPIQRQHPPQQRLPYTPPPNIRRNNVEQMRPNTVGPKGKPTDYTYMNFRSVSNYYSPGQQGRGGGTF